MRSLVRYKALVDCYDEEDSVFSQNYQKDDYLSIKRKLSEVKFHIDNIQRWELETRALGELVCHRG